MDDLINRPPHYADRRYEAIDVIEDAISRASNPVLANCQGQVLRYILRMWDKDQPAINALKARWYLNRLIDKLDSDANQG